MKTSLDIPIMCARVEFEPGEVLPEPCAFHVTVDLGKLTRLYRRAFRQLGKASELEGAITVEQREPSR